ncbi:MAG TPA: F0F1 ATP synthase subunit B [Acidimicrobiales bacterium]|nr:F0F1 ATP synthase subunit B [Acidimicrobiales bacterium]
MRTRKLLAALLVVALGFVAFAGSASAATHPRDPKGEAEKECIEKLENGGAIDDCQKAPSPIKPANNELIWGAIAFVVLLFLMWKFAYPGIKKGMTDRSERIRKSVEDADTAKAQAETTLEEYRAQLADAKNEAARIVEEARQQADALKRDREASLQSELASMRERAAADIESSKAQAIADLRAEVARLAIGAAEVVVQHNLDASTQTQLVENYIDQVGARA